MWKEATPAAVQERLDRGADPRARSTLNQPPVDLADKNEHLQGIDVYWRLNEARF